RCPIGPRVRRPRRARAEGDPRPLASLRRERLTSRGKASRLRARRDAIAKRADAFGAQLDQRTRPELARRLPAVLTERAERERVVAYLLGSGVRRLATQYRRDHRNVVQPSGALRPGDVVLGADDPALDVKSAGSQQRPREERRQDAGPFHDAVVRVVAFEGCT